MAFDLYDPRNMNTKREQCLVLIKSDGQGLNILDRRTDKQTGHKTVCVQSFDEGEWLDEGGIEDYSPL